MLPKSPPKIILTEDKIAELKAFENAKRADSILQANEGMSNKAIAESLCMSEGTVAKWRNRYFDDGIEGLKNNTGKGRKSAINKDIRLEISQILNQNPNMSRRDIQKEVEDSYGIKVSHTTIQRVLEETGLRTDPQETWAKNEKLEFKPKVMMLLGLSQHGDHAALFIGLREGQMLPPIEAEGFQQYDDKQSLLIAQLVSRDLNTEISNKQREAGKIILDIEYAMSLNPDLKLYVVLYAPEKNKTVVKWLEKQADQLEFHSASSFDTWLEMVEMQLKLLARNGLSHNVLGSKAEVVRKIIENIQEIKSQGRIFGWWFNRGISKL